MITIQEHNLIMLMDCLSELEDRILMKEYRIIELELLLKLNKLKPADAAIIREDIRQIEAEIKLLKIERCGD